MQAEVPQEGAQVAMVGEIVEPVRELSSLLGQAFVPEYKDDGSLRLP